MLCTVYVVYECALSAGLDLPGGLGGFNPPGQKSDPSSKSWTNVFGGGGCKLTPQETTQRLCSLLMLLMLSTDNNYAAILIDRFVLLLSDAYCATFMQCNATFRDFSLPVFSLLGAKVPTGNFRYEERKYRGAKSPDTP